MPLVSGSSRAQGKSSTRKGVEQWTEDGGVEQHWARWRGSKCSSDVAIHTLLLSSLLLSFGLHPTPCLHFCAVGDREYACCLAVIHGSDKSVHLLQNHMCSLLLVSLLSQEPFPCHCSSTTLIWSRYLSLCLCLFLTWTHKYPFLRTVEGLSSLILLPCCTWSWWWLKVGFAQEKELVKNYCFFKVACSLLALTEPSSPAEA